MTSEITNILNLWKEKKIITNTEIAYLLTEELNDLQLTKAWNTNENSLTERANLFIEVEFFIFQCVWLKLNVLALLSPCHSSHRFQF